MVCAACANGTYFGKRIEGQPVVDSKAHPTCLVAAICIHPGAKLSLSSSKRLCTVDRRFVPFASYVSLGTAEGANSMWNTTDMIGIVNCPPPQGSSRWSHLCSRRR